MIKPTPKNQDGKLLMASNPSDVLLLFTAYKGKEIGALYIKDRLSRVFAQGDGLPLGTVCIGKVSEIRPEMNSAFLLLAGKQKCFIHLNELTPEQNLRRPGSDVKCGDDYVVRIIKEPAKGKLASATAKLKEDEMPLFEKAKNRTDFYILKKKDYIGNALDYLTGLVNNNIGAGGNQDVSGEDFNGEINRSVRIISDTESIYKVIGERLESDDGYDVLKAFLSEDSPRFYQDELVKLSVLYRLEAQLEEALCKRVWLKSGAYLVIEYTEAMTVIDVNSGKCEKHSGEDYFLEINKEAGSEILRQLVLRNLSGMIVIDFINLKNKNSQKELSDFMQNAIRRSDPESRFFGFTNLGLAEMTRKKNGKPLFEQF